MDDVQSSVMWMCDYLRQNFSVFEVDIGDAEILRGMHDQAHVGVC